jgi:DNA-binding response OmpR family regulator
MNRVLVIDQDRTAVPTLGLEGLAHATEVRVVENLCEGVRVLLSEAVALIVVEAGRLRLPARAHAALFERVAPGVPVVVVVGPETALATRVGFELAGFRVLARPVAAEALPVMGAQAR